MYKMRHLLVVVVASFIGIVKPLNQLNIAVTSPVRQGQDDLRITCFTSGSNTITSYSIYRNDSSPTLKALVTRTVYYNMRTATISTTWPNDNQNVQGRAVLSGNSLLFPNATFILTIPKTDISCPGDAGGYQCRFTKGYPGNQLPTSNQEFVEIETNPSQMNPMTVLANTGSGNVPVTNYRFSVGTVLTLSCTGTVGNPIQSPRWCHKKTSDFGWQSPSSGVSTDGAVLVGCQNSQTTTYIHIVTSDDDNRMFLCEAGSNPQCGFGDISSNITISLGIVKPKNQLNILVTSPVRQGQDNLRITCSASGTISSITSYSIFRNDSSPTLKVLVTRTYSVITQTITTTWPNDDHNVQGRAVLSGNPLPFPNASFVLTIPRDDISCPGDAGGYQCQFAATATAGNQAPYPTSNQEFVEIQTNPSQMNPITVLAITGSGNVPVTNYRFSVGTVLTLSCTGTVGNPIQSPRWCHRKISDFGWQSPPCGVSTDGAVLVGCQNVQTTTYIHIVTSDDNDRMFLCEAGSNPQCGFGEISSNITMSLFSSATETNIDKGKENDTVSPLVQLGGNIMFGIGFTLFLLALAMFTVVFILYKKKSKGKRNDTYETAIPTNPQVRSEDHNYSTLGAQENYVTVN